MYKVARLTHAKYGPVIEITRDELGEYDTPFYAVNKAISLRAFWLREGEEKVRFLIDGQVMISKRAETWANEEYKSLPKCEECAKILKGSVFTHKYCGSNLFCSQACADKNFNYIVSQWEDETEFDL